MTLGIGLPLDDTTDLLVLLALAGADSTPDAVRYPG